MAGIENSIVFSNGERLEESTPADITVMQATSTDISRINYTGDPEGAVSANPSSLCHDPVSGILYLKYSGTGNTGWSPISSSNTDLHTARFIVASSTLGTGANYTTIAAAITAAVATGINSTIFIQPGTYTEDFTLPVGINLCAFDCDALTPNVIISGTITCTDAGARSIAGIRLQTNSAPFLTVSGSAATIVHLTGCFLNASNNTGISYTSSSASSIVRILKCQCDVTTTGITLFSASSTGTLLIRLSNIMNSGQTVTNSTRSAGILSITNSTSNVPITTSGTAALGIQNSTISTDFGAGTTCITVNGSGTNNSQDSVFQSGTAISISVGNNLNITNCSISTTNATAAIAGAGTVSYAALGFLSTGSNITATTQVPLVISNDAVKVVSASGASYTTVPQDQLILVDGAVTATIVPLASPTTGQKHIIKDNAGTAAANNITITPSGKNIDGAASSVININYGSVTIIYNGTQWNIV